MSNFFSRVLGVCFVLGGAFACVGSAHAAVTVMALDTAGLAGNEVSANATTIDPNLQSVSVTRGGGINPVVLANAFSSTAYVVGGNKAAAITNAEYLQFTLEPKTDYRMSLSALNINIRRSGTGPNAYQWQYSLNNFATAGVDVGAVGAYVGTEANGVAMASIDLSGVSALQDVPSGQRVTFRLYAWGATGAAGTYAIGRLAGDDLVVTGQVSKKKIAAFELAGQTGDQVTYNASTLDALAEQAVLSRGLGIEPSFLLNAFSSRHFTLNGFKADAVGNGDYMQAAVRAKEFYRLYLGGIDFNIRRSSTGPVSYQWQYSTDDFSSAGSDVGAQGSYTSLADDGTAAPAIDLSGTAGLQGVKNATFRLYGWGAAGTAGTLAFGRRPGDDLSFLGTVLPNKIVAFDPLALTGDQVSFDATKLDVGVVTSTLSRGPGIATSFLLRGFSANDFTLGGNKAQALAAGDYFQYSVAPKTGYHLKLKYLDANVRRSGTGPNAYQWQYSLDNFATAGVDVGAQTAYAGTDDEGLAGPQIDLSAHPSLANIPTGQTVTFRLYAWGATGAPGSFAIGRLDGDDLYLTGEAYLNTYTLAYSAGANGSLSGSSTQMVNHGSNGLAVTAVPNVGYHFVDWSDASTANPRTDLNVTGNLAVTANFAINTYTLNYAAGPNGTVVGNLSQNVNHGSDGTTITAMPDQGYVFVDWSDSSTVNSRLDTNVTGNVNVVANFQPLTPEGGGAFFPPVGIGMGKHDVTVAMHATREIGKVDQDGLNLLAFIGSTARFVLDSGKALSLNITDVDLFRNRVKFEGPSGAKGVTLDLGQSIDWDADADGVSDLHVTFSGVYINRVELTLKSLPAKCATACESTVSKKSVATAAVSTNKKLSFNRDLKTGMIHSDVKLLQIWLNNNGYVLTPSGPGSPGNETDKFGAMTRQALSKFQRASGIKPASGYFGPLTREKLNK